MAGRMEATFTTIDEYIESFPEDVQVKLREMRRTINGIIPQAEEAIRYGMPTFRLNDHNLVHFAAFKHHIGFYPTPSGIEAFKEELSKYEVSKGTIRFPLDKPLPLELISKIVRMRVEESRQKKDRY